MQGEGWSAWPAPAKLNLFLRILGQRADGYHDLQTVFQLLDWGDTVHLRVREDGAIDRGHGAAGVAPAQDLAVRAAHLLQLATGCALGADICVDKRIPMGGGLGGGSSNAATVLYALDRLWGTSLGGKALATLALKLGADVPVFVLGHSAWAEGVGEQLTAVTLPEASYVIVDTQVAVATGPLFQAPELTRNAAPATISAFDSGAATENAFEPVVRARFPQVAAALDWLGGFGTARLTGSGGCVFLATDSRVSAQAIADRCPTGFKAWVAGGVNLSPLLAEA